MIAGRRLLGEGAPTGGPSQQRTSRPAMRFQALRRWSSPLLTVAARCSRPRSSRGHGAGQLFRSPSSSLKSSPTAKRVTRPGRRCGGSRGGGGQGAAGEQGDLFADEYRGGTEHVDSVFDVGGIVGRPKASA